MRVILLIAVGVLCLARSNAADINGYAHVYLGCFLRDDVEWAFTTGPVREQFMTPFGCIEHCESMDLGYVALTDMNACYCGGSLSEDFVTASEKLCNSACSGDKNQMCGGNVTMSLYARATMPEVARPPSADGEWITLVTNDSAATFSTISPGRRAGHTAIATSRGGMFIFGGYTVWETRIVNISVDTAGENDESVNASLTESVTVYVYTWTGEVTRSNSVWRFDLASYRWLRQHNGIGVAPAPRSSHSAVICAQLAGRGLMIVFGGYTGSGDTVRELDDMWAYDIDKKLWTEWDRAPPGEGPRARGGHSAVTVNDTTMIIYGGATSSEYMADVWKFDFLTRQWTLISDGSGHGPSARSDHGAVLSPSGTMVVTFGRGLPRAAVQAACGVTTFGDTWELDIDTAQWRLLSEATGPWDATNHRWALAVPDGRFGHTASVTKNSMIIFGGARETDQLSDAWVFDFGSNAWQELEQPKVGPSNRSGFSAIAAPDGIIIFGGEMDAQLYFNDVWRWRYAEDFEPTVAPDEPLWGFTVGVSLGCFWAAVLLAAAGFYLPRRIRRIAAERHKQTSVATLRLSERAAGVELAVMPCPPTGLLASPIGTEPPRDRNCFDRLPDEVVVMIFCRLEGFEIGRMAMTCKRFRLLARDETCWRAVVERRWQHEPLYRSSSALLAPDEDVLPPDDLPPPPPDGVNYLDYYVSLYRAAQSSRKEARMYRVLAAARTTTPVYFVCFLASLQVYVTSLAIDQYIVTSWHLIFTPLWLVNLAMVVVAALLAYFVLLRKTTAFDKAVRRLYPFVQDRLVRLFLAAAVGLWVIGCVFVAQKLDGLPPLDGASWGVVLLPFMLLLASGAAYPIVAMYSARRWRWRLLWPGVAAGAHLVSLVLVAGKLDGVQALEVDWRSVLIPWWSSDAFLAAAVFIAFRSIKDVRLAWLTAVLGAGYLASVAVFQALSCVELETIGCDARTSYGFVAASLPLQFIVCVLGLLAALLVRKRSAKLFLA